MIDAKSKLVLNILAKECKNGSYKIIEISDIIMALPKHFRMDSEAVKHTLAHLERQDMISIKYDDDGVYCLAVLPYGYENLEGDVSGRQDKKFSVASIILSFFSALIGTTIGVLICYFLFKLF